MNAIRVIGILIASLALIGVADAQKGGGKPGGGGGGSGDTLASLNCSTDQIARFNGTAWVCSQDRTTSVPVYRVVDGNGTTLPYPILRFGDLYNAAHVFADIEIEGQLEKVLVAITENEIYSIDYGVQIFYTTSTCTDQGYIYPNNMHWFQRRMYAVLEPLSLLYYSSRDPQIQTIEVFGQRSVYANSALCESTGGGFTRDVVPVQGSVPFAIPFAPPYTLVTD